jgi:hypothetical protein
MPEIEGEIDSVVVQQDEAMQTPAVQVREFPSVPLEVDGIPISVDPVIHRKVWQWHCNTGRNSLTPMSLPQGVG